MNPDEASPVQVEVISSGSNWPKLKITLITGIPILLVLIFLILFFFHLLPFQKPKSTAKSVPATLNMARGNLTSIAGDSLTVDVYGTPKTFSITNTKEFNKLLGKDQTGKTKTGPASVSELKVGQEVLIIADPGSSDAKVVYILQ